MSRRPVDELRELERRDTDLRARAARLQELDSAVATLREQAEAIDRFFAAYPAEDTRLRELATAARLELTQRQAELEQAQAELERARNQDARLLATRRLDRAVDHVAVAEVSVERARTAHDALERQAAALPEELSQLEGQAGTASAELPGVPAPGTGPLAIVDWASRAHASIFVTLGSIDTQRDRVIREANELASMLLGEPTYGSTVSQVTARVDATLASDDSRP